MRAFAREGARPAAVDLGGERLDAIIADARALGAKAIAVPTDLTREADAAAMVQAAVDTFGKLDVAFNNAGIHIIGTPIPRRPRRAGSGSTT